MCPRRMLVLLIPAILVGCSTWATSTDPVPGVAAAHQGDHVRVVVEGRPAYDLYDVETLGDSLVGRTGAGDRHAVAIADVESMQVQKTDTAKTGLLMGGILIVVLVVAYAVASAAATASLLDGGF
ncbi:MAG: hypothetical protein WBO43_08530 [Gemmatimonadota bacterium]